MNQVFKIFPSIGYRNTQFQVVGFADNLTIQIEHGGQPKILINLPQTNKAIIKKFNSPGLYIATCNVNGNEFKQTLVVKDAVRLGTSKLKTAFTFDQIPYSIFLMHDRMLIYDETEKVLREENEISPSNIKQIDESHLLLVTSFESVTSKKGITNYGIYSLINFSIVSELTSDYTEILHSEKENTLWLYNSSENKILCFDLKSISEGKLKITVEVDSIGNYCLNKLCSHLFAQSNNSIFIINLKTFEIKTFEKEISSAFDEDGNYFILKDNILICTNLLVESGKQIIYSVPANFSVSPKRFYYLGKNFTTTQIISDFDINVKEFSESNVSNLDNSKTYQYLSFKDVPELIEEKISCELFPSENGIHIVIRKVNSKFNGTTYRKDNKGLWKFSPNIITSFTYSLIHSVGKTSKTIIESSSNFSVYGYFELLLIIRNDNKTQFINQGQIIREVHSISEYSLKSIQGTNTKYLFEKTGINYNVFSSSNFSFPILNDVEIFNYDLIEKQSAIWYTVNQKNTFQNFYFLQGHDLITGNQILFPNTIVKHSRYSDVKEIIFKEKYFLSSCKAFVHPYRCDIKDAVFGSVINTSNTLNKVITMRDENFYLLKFDSNLKRYLEEIIDIKLQKNSESYFSPNGKFLMLQKEPNKYVYYDIENDEEVKFFSEKFLAFSKEGNLIFEEDVTRAVKVFDPLTFKDVTPLNYHHYRFLSPDGELYSQLILKTRFFDLLENKYIDTIKYNEYKSELDGTTSYSLAESEKTRKALLQKREKFYYLNKNKLNEINIKSFENLTTDSIIRIEKFTEIGIVGTTVTTEITFPQDITYFNYAAFSYDNKFLGGVCRASSSGLIKLFKLNYNKAEKKLTITDEYLSRYPRMASWVCGFSNTSYFATYDSTPNTYILNVNDELFEQKTKDEDLKKNILGNDFSIYRSYKNWIEIKGKNFLCFNPNGNYLALSEQGYEPLTLGGYGHQESSVIHIAKTINGEIVDSFLGHGDAIKDDKNKKVVFVAFSEDEKQIMSMSADGVVIVRKIDLQKVRTGMTEIIKVNEYINR
jgi:hypothetical protein